MVLAVLEAHCGVRLSGHDVYLNVAGGLRIQEPAADLAAAAALVSSLANAPLPADAVYFGEISLSGAVRPVAQAAARLKEAQKLGFARAIVPDAARAEPRSDSGLTLESVASLANLVADIAARGRRPGPPGSARRGRSMSATAMREPLSRIADPPLEQDRAGRVVDEVEQERPVDAELFGFRGHAGAAPS